MGFETLQVVIMVDLDGGIFDRLVHPLGLATGSAMVGSGQPMTDAVCDAYTVEDVWITETEAETGAVFGRPVKAVPLQAARCSALRLRLKVVSWETSYRTMEDGTDLAKVVTHSKIISCLLLSERFLPPYACQMS